MAFFKFRKGGDDSPAAPPQPESVEVVRRRARHRLIGAAVLVLLGVIGFPLLFDTQPRPVAVDIPIEIPDRNKARPLPPPQPSARTEAKAGQAAAPVQAARGDSAPARPVASGAVTSAPAEARPPATEAPRTVAEAAKPQPATTAPLAPATKPAVQPAPGAPPAAKPPPADAARAQALLEGKPTEVAAVQAPAGERRFVVQVGAFSDAAKARETRLKVEKAGLKTYTQEASTKDGKRIRVRVGPFPTRAEADKAAGRIKELDLPADVLTLS